MKYPKTYPDLGNETVAEFMRGQEDRIEQTFNAGEITSGSNERGSWTKFPDGTMICRLTDERTTGGNNFTYAVVPLQGLSIHVSQGVWVFPISFSDIPTVSISGDAEGGGGIVGYKSWSPTKTDCQIGAEGMKKPPKYTLYLTAIGRWK